MNNKCKKVLALIAAGMLTASTLAACGGELYKGNTLAGYTPSQNAAVSNGGFAVQKDEYIYFINAAEDYTATNEYGEVVKGALMRVPANNLAATAETVVPMLFVAQNFDAGIYIYGDYVYYATPTTDKNMSGDVENSWIDFKRAKLDGSEAMKDYYFRLSNNASNYRFVQGENGVVYCLYEEDSALKSFNTSTRTTTTLVKNAKSSFFYDASNPENANVYYTMSVVADADSDNATTASYDQLYCVNAAATVTSVNADAASYTVSNGKTYDFDENYLKEQNKEAKDSDTDEPYDLKDYTTYPYVNLGTLVLDGRGSNALKTTQFNGNVETTALTPDGYNYTVTGYQNGGVYFTRAEVAKTSSEGESTKLYYLADSTKNGAEWNVVSGNATTNFAVVADNTTNTGSAVFYIDAQGNHGYLYVSEGAIMREGYDVEGAKEKVNFKTSVTDATLWKIDGDYLYFWQAAESGNGNNLQRINYKGTQDDYNLQILQDNEEYQPLVIKGVEWNSSWYEPEFFGDTVLYSNAQTFGANAYNYIYKASLGTTAAIADSNAKYDKVQDYIDEYADYADLQSAMQYYFRTGRTTEFEAVRDLYDEYEQDEFDKFVADTTFAKEQDFITLLGAMKSDDAEAIEESWAAGLLSETTTEEEDEGLDTWAIVLICVGSALVVAAAVLVPLLVVRAKKKAKAAEAEATVNAYKRKIDTTDDKSIDVYADEESEAAEETVEEEATPAEENAEEAAAETEETAPAEEEKKDE